MVRSFACCTLLWFLLSNTAFAATDNPPNYAVLPEFQMLEQSVEAGRKNQLASFVGVYLCTDHTHFEILAKVFGVNGDASSVSRCVEISRPAFVLVSVKKYEVHALKGCIWDVEVVGDLDPSIRVSIVDTETNTVTKITNNISLFLRVAKFECGDDEI